MDDNKTDSPINGSPKYWLSIDQWSQDPEFAKLAEKEFQSSPLQSEEGQDGWARREFLKLMGASMALSTFGCVRRPAQKIVPYVNRPPEITPGKINYYSSSFVDGSFAYGLVVATREGRPIKTEGNFDHPVNKNGMSARAHAHLLSLYDPDRGTQPQINELNENKTNFEPITASVTWDSMDKQIVEELKKGSVGVLTSTSLSPSSKSLLKDFAQTFGAKNYSWDAVSLEDVREGQKVSYGEDTLPFWNLSAAKYVLTIDCDILGTVGQPVENMRNFAKGRAPGKEMNKLVSFESMMSLTGSNADERYRIRPSQQMDVVMGLLHELIVGAKVSRYASDSNVKKLLEPYSGVAERLGIDSKVFSHIAADLWAYKGQSLVVAGGMVSQSESQLGLQVAVNFLNSVLENDGKTVLSKSWNQLGYQGSYTDMAQLIKDMDSGKIQRLIIWGANPGYSFSKSPAFIESFKKLKTAVYLGDRVDETGKMCNYFAPVHHDMENWGDMEAVEGVYSIQQPTLSPLYNTRSAQDSLIKWSKLSQKGSAFSKVESWYEYLREYWKNNIYSKNRSVSYAKGDFEEFWYEVLQRGVFDTSRGIQSHSSRNFNLSALKNSEFKSRVVPEFELVLYPTIGIYDGSLANVSWLQEFPDPVTKICWDNYVNVSPKNARELKLHEGDLVSLTVEDKTLQVPVHIQPGQSDQVLALAIGYGRTRVGRVANGVGSNAFDLVSNLSGRPVFSGINVKIEKTGGKMKLANTQGHHSMEGRQIVVEATVEQYMHNPGANIHRHKMMSMWSGHEYKGHKWAMAIDQSVCTGCSACVVACQSENNIPVVGKKYVLQGREMHWIRIDRYFTGTPEDPGVVYQPLPCQHCDNAPCETVCPVAATTHSSEGTNDMIYNRCVGTRYCANNCYYKVRRFNWFDYTEIEAPMHMALNPEVTVRARGVMEKCTFCIHRIKGAKHFARVEGREFKAEEVKTACQISCPTGAIVFGDMNDQASDVSKMFKDGRSYALLEEFNAAPAVRYQSKIRNTDSLKGGKSHGEEGHH